MNASLTRRYRFSASHRLHTPALSNAENEEVFGKCNNPYGHGHNYEISVTVRGPVNPQTGLVVVLARLDEYVSARILSRFANRNINHDVEEFQDVVPTTENLTVVAARFLERDWISYFGSDGVSMAGIYIQETGRNGFEFVNSRTKESNGVSAAAAPEAALHLKELTRNRQGAD